MKFGKTDNLNMSALHLPADEGGNGKLIKGVQTKTPRVYLGLPVFSEKELAGKIYPPGTPPSKYLDAYARRFEAIEFNATRYRMPTPSVIKTWVSKTPAGFRFCPKFPQSISHAKAIDGKPEAVGFFVKALESFGNRLGVAFLQLPAWFKPARLKELVSLLDMLPAAHEYAVELRNPEWFQAPSFDIISEILRKRGIAFVITDTPGRRDVLHQRLTSRNAFVRFTGSDLHPTDFKRMDQWVNRVAEWAGAGLPAVWFFLHQPTKHLAAETAHYFSEKLVKAGIEVPLLTIDN